MATAATAATVVTAVATVATAGVGVAAIAAVASSLLRQGGRTLAAALPFALLSADPLRAAGPETTRDIRVSESGFTPRRIEVRRGDAVRLLLTSADGEHCFAIDELRIEKRVVPDRTTRVDFTPEKAGSLAFYDCLAPDHQGNISVAE